jgi:hypothetical protein
MSRYDAWLEAPYYPENGQDDPDEGVVILTDAIEYLESLGEDEDAEDAVGTLRNCLDNIQAEYECRMCGSPLPKPWRYCSRNCARADAEGM